MGFWYEKKNEFSSSDIYEYYFHLGASVATTVAGSTSDPGPWPYQLNNPTSILIDPYGFLYILDFTNERIQKWLPGALFGTTVAAADMWNPCGMAMDPLGNFYVADTSFERIISFGLLCRKFVDLNKFYVDSKTDLVFIFSLFSGDNNDNSSTFK